MKRIIMICTFVSAYFSLAAQDYLWVFFEDKGDETICNLAHPEDFLSPLALEIRAEKGIPFSISDLPVYQPYLMQLANISGTVQATSKWLNAAVVPNNPGIQARIEALDFVAEIKPVRKLIPTNLDPDMEEITDFPDANKHFDTFNYGRARMQNDMINMGGVHAKGYSGKGVRIAIFDAGYSGVDTIDVFDSLRLQNRIIATYDFVDKQENVFHSHSHGTQVLSTIAANLPGKMIGTAPHASFVLARTEDDNSESLKEEYNWMKAMEWADSIGVDVIHSSLGYTTFDDEAENHTYDELDGNTTVITRAADIAASKGILVTTSAGNEGANSWRHIAPPCDADSILCIGAVDKYKKRSYFSSIGPTSDDRVKPDVVAMGTRTIVAHPNNRIYGSNGTSFSSPLIAGLVVCLKQAHPDRSGMDIFQAIRLSSDQYGLPDAEYGYGIPDAGKADSLLNEVEDLGEVKIVMTEKPHRGKVQPPLPEGPKEAPITIVSVQQTNASLAQSEDKVTVTVDDESARVRKVKVYRGKQKLTFDPEDLIINGNKVEIGTSYLLPGEYEIRLVTQGGKANLSFTVK